MALASSNLYELRYAEEPSFGGATPTTGFATRNSGESLTYAIQTATSQEIRSDRQTTDLVQVGASANGGFNFEMSYNEHDALLAAALMGSWSVYGTNGVGSTFTADFTATTITASVAPTGSSAFTTLAKGQWFKLNAPTHANDGKWFRVSESVSPTSTVITVSAATPLTTGSGVTLCSVASSRLTNGVTMKHFALERAHTDIGQFFVFKGMTPNKVSLQFQSGSITTGSFDFMGKNTVRATSTAFSTAINASLSYDIMNSVAGIGYVLENNTALSGTFIKSLTLDLDNAIRAQDAIGVLGAAGVAPGTCSVSGNMEVYLADGALYDKFVANTASSLSWNIKDGSGNGYAFTLPKVKFGDAKVNAGALNQDVMLSLPFTGLMDTVTGKTMLVDRAGVAVTR